MGMRSVSLILAEGQGHHVATLCEFQMNEIDQEQPIPYLICNLILIISVACPASDESCLITIKVVIES